MKVFYEVKVLAVIPTHFVDKEGLTVEYDECYFLYETDAGERSVIKMNTKNPSVREFEEEEAVIEIESDLSGRSKPRLVGIKSGR